MQDKPIRVQRKRTKGWRMPPNTVSVTRPGKWGNPFKVGDSFNDVWLKTPGMVVEAHMRWLEMHPSLMLDAQRELRGKNLCCFCQLDSPCHADNLLKVANL